MLKAEITVGTVYRAVVSGNLTDVRIDSIKEIDGKKWIVPNSFGLQRQKNAKTRYQCTNLKTGRQITIKSAAKLRRVVTAEELSCR